jgi:hypothetical protein
MLEFIVRRLANQLAPWFALGVGLLCLALLLVLLPARLLGIGSQASSEALGRP